MEIVDFVSSFRIAEIHSKKKRESCFEVFAFIFIVFPGNYEFSLVDVNNFGNAITVVRVWKVVVIESFCCDNGRSAHQT